ncbi:hypothetical protein ACFWJS_10880 [Streptomyces sp. NPDC127061]|uniref:hypothetical protein n=1 Tax=Streptomyces sp. NPDC127061 TaxID=3347122 RepID=UPI00364F31E5
MRTMRRIALYVALPLVLLLAAGYSWYRMSDTGKRWRYEDRLATYCEGLIPAAESAALTSYSIDPGLPGDRTGGADDNRWDECGVADTRLLVALIPHDAVRNRRISGEPLSLLRDGSSDHLPVAVGGGWQGHTDFRDTGIVLNCTNRPASLVVTVSADESHENAEETRRIARLATATAERAAERWSCDAPHGSRVPTVPVRPDSPVPGNTTGTCAGVPVPGDDSVDWHRETTAPGTALLETCALGETKARDEELYWFGAAFGPYAQRLRTSDDGDSGGYRGDAGTDRHSAWASAACGKGPRALFTVNDTEYAAPPRGYLRTALRAFAERAAQRHGCTDLKLPS